jgi:GT2 family glycosyltransferase
MARRVIGWVRSSASADAQLAIGLPMQQVLVIVLNHNKKDMVLDCIASLTRQTYSPIHIVVVDNASTDGSREALQRSYPCLDLLCQDQNLGAIGGRNEGYSYAKQKGNFDFVLFLDDDAEVAAGSIGLLVEALNHDALAGLACGKTYVNFQSNTLMSAGIRERLYLGLCHDRGAGDEDRGQFDRDEYVDACGSFAMMIRAALFEEIGGFDEAFTPYGWEDVDFCLRARARGQRTRYVPAATFAHKGTRLGRGPIPVYERHKARNFLKLLRRHTTPLQKLTAAVFVPLRGLLLLSRFAIHGDWRAIPAQLKGVLDYFRSSKRDLDKPR